MNNSIKNHLEELRTTFYKYNEGLYASCCVKGYKLENEKIYLIVEGELSTEIIRKYINDSESRQEIVRPFFYGFEATVELELFLNKFSILIESSEKNLTDCVIKNKNNICFEKKLMHCLNHNCNFEKCMQSIISEVNSNLFENYYSMEFNEDNYDFKADVFFAASPFEYSKSRCIKIKSNNKLQKGLNINFNSLLIDNLKDLKDLNFDSIEVLNVGQGNCEFISTNSKNILFDVGFTKSESHDDCKFDRAKTIINNFDGGIVIISHTDIDHILGVIYLNDEAINNSIWIFPKIDEKYYTNSAKSLLIYLCENNSNNTFFLEKDVVSGYIRLFRGSNCNNSETTYINSSGILLNYENNDCKILLTGDCPYSSILEQFRKQYDFLVVPHHGYEVGCLQIINGFLGKNTNNCFAIVSVGKNNYSHPNQEHLNKLSKCYNVLKTVDFNSIVYKITQKNLLTK